MAKRKQRKASKAVTWGVVLLVVLGVWFAWKSYEERRPPGALDAFAKCIDVSGATFYGAFWCPACNNQKEAFGRSEKFLPYVECSTPDRQSQTAVCVQAGIQSYPTWVFPDGAREIGFVPLSVLSEKTGCQLPAT